MESKYRIYLFCQEKKYSTILHCYTNYQIAYFGFFDKLLFDYKMAVHCILNLCSTSPTIVKSAINFLWHLHYNMDVKWNLFMIKHWANSQWIEFVLFVLWGSDLLLMIFADIMTWWRHGYCWRRQNGVCLPWMYCSSRYCYVTV